MIYKYRPILIAEDDDLKYGGQRSECKVCVKRREMCLLFLQTRHALTIHTLETPWGCWD